MIKNRIGYLLLCAGILLAYLPVSALAADGNNYPNLPAAQSGSTPFLVQPSAVGSVPVSTTGEEGICTCEGKCDKEMPEASCPVCSLEVWKCQGEDYGISLLLSGDYVGSGGSKVSYCTDGTTVDVHGENGKKTTYNNNGYVIKTENLENASITATPSIFNNGHFVRVAYTVTNSTGAEITGKLGVHADVMIGTDDCAEISVVKSAATPIGFKMVEANNGGQFNLFFAGTGGVTNANTHWIGKYNERQSNCFNTTSLDSYGGYGSAGGDGDSGLAFSWNVEVPANSSREYSFIVGVGEVAPPAQWAADKPVALTMSAEATREDLVLSVSALVRDATGVTDTLFYNINGGSASTLGNSVVGDGTEKEIKGEISLKNLADGTYSFQFWVVNSKGAASESVTRVITIQGQQITGDVIVCDHDWGGWSKDDAQHWKECTKERCNMRASAADHSWVVDQVTKVDNAYYDNYKCSVCDHVKVEPHTHSWSYTAADNVLTATCAEEKCPLHSGVSLTVKAENGEYNKNPHAASFGSREDEVWTSAGLTLPTIQYRNPNDDLLSQAPKNVGTYTAFIQVGDVTAEKTFSIAVATVTTPTVASKPYTGELQKATIDTAGKPYSVKTNGGGTDAGSYPVVFELLDDTNYQWDTNGGITTFCITQAENRWTAGPSIQGWTYGETKETPTGSAKFGTVTVQYRHSDGTYRDTAPTDAGDYKARFTVAGNDNYTGLSTEKNFTIQERTVKVTKGISAADKEYDGTTVATLDCTGAVFDGKLANDSLTVSASGTFDSAEVGNGKVVRISDLTLVGTHAKNYALSTTGNQAVTNAHITKKPVAVQLTVTPKVYDGTTDAQITAEIPAGALVGNDSIAITGLSGSFERKDAGENQTVTVDASQKSITGSGLGHYAITIPTTATGTITKAPLTITAKDNTITYGDAPAANGVDYSGFVNQETPAVLGGQLAYTINYRQYDNAGSTYTITPKGLTSDNYAITFRSGNLTVLPKSLREVSAALEKTAYAPTGSAIAPSVTAADGNRALVPDRDFTVGYDNNNPTATPATAVVTITGTGNYKDSVTLKFVITDALTRIPALPQSGEPDDLDTIDAYEAAKAALDAMDAEQKALLGDLAGELEETLDTLLEALTDYRIIRGGGSRWSQNSGRSLSFTANGALRKFSHLQVDGITLAGHHYTLKSGSTIVTLSKDYLSTLKVGTHILQIFYSDGQTDVASFRIHPPAANPITGDTSPVLLLGGVFAVALVGVVMTMAFKKRLTYQPKYRK